MSTVIRDAVIRLKIEQQKAKLEAPDISKATKAYDDQTKAAKESAKATKENERAVLEVARAHEDFGRRSVVAFAHAGHGVMQFARGYALMAASNSADSQKMLENIIKIEGAVSLAKGAGNLLKFAAGLTPLGKAYAAVAAVVATGIAIFGKWGDAGENEAKRVTEAMGRTEAGIKKMQAEWDKAIAKIDARRQSERRISDLELEKSGLPRDESEFARQARYQKTQASLATEEDKRAQAAADTVNGPAAGAKAAYERSRGMAGPGAAGRTREAEESYKRLMGSARDDQTEVARIERQRYELVKQERDTQLALLKDQQSRVGQSGLSRTEAQDRFIKSGDPDKEMQRRDKVDLDNQATAQIGRMFGAPTFTQKEIDEGFASKTKEVERAFTELMERFLENMKTIERRRADFEKAATQGFTS